MMMVNRE